ncbi:hypothetical protein SBO82_15640, partial [Alcaligenes nematophilus]|uniref:hypothetical protein n=1 Tax=Alcaligenes nematophilus TaxID=2994643 RepID=UPI00245957C8
QQWFIASASIKPASKPETVYAVRKYLHVELNPESQISISISISTFKLEQDDHDWPLHQKICGRVGA